jgi:hypothetical protein
MKLKRIINSRQGLMGRLVLVAATASLAAAAPAVAAPQWLIPQTVSQLGYDASQQQVTLDGSGEAVAVWQSSGGANPVIDAAEHPSGGTWSAPQALSDESAYALAPDVASDARGDAVAVWLHYDGAYARVQAAYRPAGGSFGAPQTLSPAGYEGRDPRVAMNANGAAVVVWSLGSGLTEKIQTASAAPGGTFGETVDLTAFTYVASVPQVALDANGDAIAVWDGWDGTNIRIEDSLKPAGGSFGLPRYLSQAGDNADTPQVAFDAAGNALAVWRFDGPPASTIAASYRPAGGEFGSQESVSAASSQPAQAPQVAFDAQGESVVAWQQSDGSELRVDASARQTGSAGVWYAQSTLDAGGREAYEPRIAGDGESGTLVSWKTFNGIANTAQVAYRPAGGSFTAATTLSAESPQEGTPQPAIDPRNDALVVWSRSSGPNYLLEASEAKGEAPPVAHTPTTTAGATVPTDPAVSTSTSATHCTLLVSHRQKGLSYGRVMARTMCSTPLHAKVSGRLSVGAQHAHSYTLAGVMVQLRAGAPREVRLTLSRKTRRAIVVALGRHRELALYVSLQGSGVQTHVRIAGVKR